MLIKQACQLLHLAGFCVWKYMRVGIHCSRQIFVPQNGLQHLGRNSPLDTSGGKGVTESVRRNMRKQRVILLHFLDDLVCAYFK